jgi:plasmid stabilization system protein ParE
MSRLQLTRRAENDLDRLTDFLLGQSPGAAALTTELVIDGLQVLRQHPRIGRVRSDGLRELVISRGKTGYVALYRYDEIRDVARVLAIRHQRELGGI